MARPTPSLRSITGRGEAVRVFAAQPSARVIAGALAVAIGARRRDRRVGIGDAVAVAAIAGTQGLHEWVIHRGLLHATPRTVRGIVIDPGVGHRAHHADPDVLEDALLRAPDAARFAAMIAVWVATICFPLRRYVRPRHVATAIAAAELGLLHYEWTHFVDHTSVPLRGPRAARLRTHHRRHHHVDDTRWLGITSTSADRVHELLRPRRT
jgi:hypothetical protein